ncbi:transposable element Tcb2 transposase [Trichonephila clavipes]|nr:transposable element Tcb2 transposase [Trichonephila clavipes]
MEIRSPIPWPSRSLGNPAPFDPWTVTLPGVGDYCPKEAQWLSSSASRSHTTGPRFKPRAGIWNRFLETGSAGRRPGQGRRRATTPNEDRYLVLTARRHRNMSATLLQQHLRSATGTTVSTQTVRNRLHGVGLQVRRTMVCVRLTSRHVNWRRNEWSNVLFSDESGFSVYPDNRHIFIWRDRGSRNNPAFVHKSVRFGGGEVLVFGGISIDGRTDLYIIRDGSLTARQYRDEIFKPIVVPYAAAIGDDFILMDDNCRPHRANLVEDFLAANHSHKLSKDWKELSSKNGTEYPNS